MQPGNDIIFIRDIQLMGLVGILPHEIATPQPLHLQLRMGGAFSTGLKDEVTPKVDYAEVLALIQKLVLSRHFPLIETLGTEIISALFAAFSEVMSIELGIEKPNALRPVAGSVELTFIRYRD